MPRFRHGTELSRAPEWRLRASSNPWDVPLAFDNNAVTRWTSYATYQPGMFVEIDLGHAEQIDEVAADRTPDQNGMNMRLEYEAAGKWQTVAEAKSKDKIE